MPDLSHFSDQGLMILHLLYASAERKHARFVDMASIRIKEQQLYNMLLQRVPVKHLWECEKLMRDLNLKTQ